MNPGAIQVVIAFLVIFAIRDIRDGILAWRLIGRALDVQPQPPPRPTPTPIPIPPGPVPPVPVPPTPVAGPRFIDITSTTFAGPSDSVSSSTSAYDGHIIRGATELAAALPYHFSKPPTIRVFANGKSVDVPVEDVGPWNTHDTYPTIPGSRPLAEAQYTNKTEAQNGQVPTNPAGLDCTPAVWKALGFTGDLETITAKVSWDDVAYLRPTPAPTPVGIPLWLAAMVDITRTHEVDGDGDSPVILGWATFIGKKFPDMASYCARYDHDSIAWCGLTVAYCMASAGIRPQFGANDIDKFLWADAWRQFGTAVSQPQPGDVLVFKWANGGHHVTFYNHETDGDKYACRGGNQSNEVNVTLFPMASCIAIRRPA